MIEDYESPTPAIESVDGDRLHLFCGDDLPAIGTAVAVEPPEDHPRLYAVVRRHAGARRADAWMPARPDWVESGLAIEPTGRPAAFAPPEDRHLTVEPQLLRPAEDGDIKLWPDAPDYTELSGRRRLLSVDIEPLDVLAPLCAGGLNLIIDNSPNADAFFELSRRAHQQLSPETTLYTGHHRTFGDVTDDDGWSINAGDTTNTQVASLQLTIALAGELRKPSRSMAIVELPQLQGGPPSAWTAHDGRRRGIADIVGRLGRHLVSTDGAELTTLLLLRPPADHPGLTTIIDSLAIGDVDATIVIDDDRRFRPDRSSSDAELDDRRRQLRDQFLSTLDRARKAEDKTAIFGDQELTDEERRAIEDAPRLYPTIG